MGGARTLLVGGNNDFLDGVVEWITHEPGIEVVGRAHDGLVALDLSESLRAELVLADVTLPDMSGFELAGRVKALPWAPLVVLLSFHDSQTARDEAWTAGADGFVCKSDTADRLLPLVGDLLRRRHAADRPVGSGIPTLRVPPADLPE